MVIAYRSAGRTETGHVRRHNEDAILLRDDLGLWVVADGLGGHAAGDYASGLIVERLGQLWRPPDAVDFVEQIEDALDRVNRDLRQATRARGVDLIGSTVVVLVYHAAIMLCGWVGDSRGYCYEDNCLRQITRDHVHGGGGDVTRFGATSPAPSPGAAALTRAVGAEDRLVVDWAVAANRAGSRFLLCSDGINKEMSDAEIGAGFQAQPEPRALVGSLFDTALARGARDNVSAIVVDLGR